MTLKRTLAWNERGDTIIEVLVAIAIISLVLVAAYAATNHNTQTLQNTQEREQMQHVAETQVEFLRAKDGIATSGDCFDVTGAEQSGASCLNQTPPVGSGATYNVAVVGPGPTHSLVSPPATCPSHAASGYMICVYWTSLGAKSNNDSSIVLYYLPPQ